MAHTLVTLASLLLCLTGTLSARLFDPQEDALNYSYQKGAVCISAAATLGNCLTAVSPASSLTTIEESDCCASLLNFQQAGCYCLPPQSLDIIAKADRWAYRRRLNALYKVHQRCGWEAFACPGQLTASKYLGVDVDTKASEQVMTASALPFWVTQADAHKLDGPDNLDWEADVVGEREARGSQRLLGSAEYGSGDVEPQIGLRSSQLSELREYISAAVDLADAMSKTQDTQIEISIEMTVESSREEDASQLLPSSPGSLLKVLLGSTLVGEGQFLNVWLALLVLVLLVALATILLQRRRQAAHREPVSLHGIVSAAYEASYNKS